MTKSIPPKNIVLYADDDIDDLQLVQDAFLNYTNNVEVITVTDGIKALKYLESLTQFDPRPCLIILDINMPRLTGKEVLIELRNTEHFKDTPVVLFSTSSLPQDKEFARRLNAGFITKPIDLRQMEIITSEFIEHCTEDIQKQIRRQIKE
jgi:CheY-like chemotaxis protein